MDKYELKYHAERSMQTAQAFLHYVYISMRYWDEWHKLKQVR